MLLCLDFGRRLAPPSRAQPATADRVTYSTLSALDRQHCRAVDQARAQVSKRAIRGRKGVGAGMNGERARSGEREELLRVPTGEIGDRADAAFAPEQTIRERRHIAHVDAGTNDGPAATDGGQGGGHQSADRRENQCCIDSLRRGLFAFATPAYAKAHSKRL